MLILPDASENSRDLLLEAIYDKFRITLLVMGDGPGVDVIASKADVRAQAMASTRRVVWVRRDALLEGLLGRAKEKWTKDGQMRVTVLSLDDEPVVWLSGNEPNFFTAVEQAFATAQQA